MAAVVNRHCAQSCRGGVVLVGYSGGGVLAVLMAPRVPSTVAVVTIAADLDTEAWAHWHGYSALDGSLNPATLPALPSRIRQWHLVGDRDTVVPPDLNRRYLNRIEPDYVWHFATFDHVCCWVQQWPELFSRIEAAVSRTRADSSY
jgi:dienelactone hydrolase